MRTVIFTLLLAWCAVSGASSAKAAGDPQAAAGLISDHCTSCHEVPGYKAKWEKAEVNAPPFQEIAQNPDAYPPAKLRTFLQKPHWPMTQFSLSPRDIDNILAFIGQLR